MASGATLPQLATREEVQSYLRGVAAEMGVSLEDPKVAEELDRRDQLAAFRKKFALPKIGQLLDEGERDDCMCKFSKCSLSNIAQFILSLYATPPMSSRSSDNNWFLAIMQSVTVPCNQP